MLFHCKKSCEQCGSDDSEDVKVILERTSQFGTTQRAEGTHKKETLEVVKSMLEYMESSTEFLSLPKNIKDHCKNKVRWFIGRGTSRFQLTLMKSFLFSRMNFVHFGQQSVNVKKTCRS